MGIEPTPSHLRCDALPVELPSPAGSKVVGSRVYKCCFLVPIASKEQGSLMSTPVVTCCHLWHSVGCSNHQAYYISSSNRNTCIQVPRFFPKKKISGLRWESNPHLHISGVMLYQLSYQALLGARWWGVGYTSVVSWCPLHLRNKVL